MRSRWWYCRGHQSIAGREINISLLDARAGSPPAASEILLRNHLKSDAEPLTRPLRNGRWSADLVAVFRSPCWHISVRSMTTRSFASLTSILDASAFVIAALKSECVQQARLTSAMARHTLVDLALVL